MKTVVLDTNELSRDFLCSGLKYQLLEHMFHATWLTVYVPAVVLEELVANHQRAVERSDGEITQIAKVRRRLGLTPISTVADQFDYRAYITERWDERLAFNVLPWPSVAHEELVERAVKHLPPFNSKGSGYRDALIWSDVLALAAEGRDIAFVSSDGVFGDAEANLLTSSRRTWTESVAGSSWSATLARGFLSSFLGRLKACPRPSRSVGMPSSTTST